MGSCADEHLGWSGNFFLVGREAFLLGDSRLPSRAFWGGLSRREKQKTWAERQHCHWLQDLEVYPKPTDGLLCCWEHLDSGLCSLPCIGNAKDRVALGNVERNMVYLMSVFPGISAPISVVCRVGKLRLQLPLVVNVGLSLGLEQRQQVWRCGGWKRLLETPVLSTNSLPVPSETLPVFREEAYVCGEDGETEALGYPSCQNEAR